MKGLIRSNCKAPSGGRTRLFDGQRAERDSEMLGTHGYQHLTIISQQRCREIWCAHRKAAVSVFVVRTLSHQGLPHLVDPAHPSPRTR